MLKCLDIFEVPWAFYKIYIDRKHEEELQNVKIYCDLNFNIV